DQLRTLLRHRTAGAWCVRDTVAIINAIGDRYPDILDMHRRLSRWLAGPDPSDESLLRASAALEILSSVLWSKELVPEAPDEVIEQVLLTAACSTLTGTDA
ncbi:MAG: TetR/AcrR family transcriptional regulator, partial [Nocardia sp.]|nr:TetR/AcrR family transcriptional regulator [Nocardia sp.]